MSVSFVVEINNMGLRIKVLVILDEVFDGFEVWKSLHAEFTIETPTDGTEYLILFLATMPHYSSLLVSRNHTIRAGLCTPGKTYHSTGVSHQL